MTLSTANIVALFALSAKAQQAPQGAPSSLPTH